MSSADVSGMGLKARHSIEEMFVPVNESTPRVAKTASREQEPFFAKGLDYVDSLSMKSKVIIYAPCVAIIYLTSSLLATSICNLMGIVFVYK
jgi:hypothetical protein